LSQPLPVREVISIKELSDHSTEKVIVSTPPG